MAAMTQPPSADFSEPDGAARNDPVAVLSARLSQLLPWFQQGGSPAGALGLTPDNLEVFYRGGYDVFQQGRFEDALKVFRWLVTLDPLQPRYHHAVATCQLRLGQHREAAASYVTLRLLEPDNPEPLVQLAECLLATGDRTEAAGLLDELFLPGAEDRPVSAEHRVWLQKAEALRSLLRHEPAPT